MPPPRTIAVPKSRFRTASKNNNKKGSKVVKDVHEEKSSHVSSEHKKEPGSPSKTSRGGVMSFLFSGRGKKESEADSKKATLAARKSIGRARRNRLSRHRRKSGSKSADEKEHHPSSGKSARRSSPSKDKFRKPVDKQLSTSKKNDSEGIPVSRSAKDLIAEMEAREKDKKSSYVKNGSVKSTTAQSSAAGSSVRSVNSSGSGLPVKRKAGEFAVPEPKAPKETTNRSVRRKSIRKSFAVTKSYLYRRQHVLATKKKLGWKW